MTNKSYGLTYFIRVFVQNAVKNSTNEQYTNEINLDNVLSINTTSSVNNSGSFRVVLDYRQGFIGTNINDPLSFIQYISPMDYIEIYLRREAPTDKDGNISLDDTDSPAGFGVFGANNQWIQPFTKDLKSIQLNQGGVTNTSLFQNSSPLDIEYKIYNPDLVFCGFITDIVNNFSGPGSNNTVVLEGKGVGHFLENHYVFYSHPSFLKGLFAAFLSSMAVPMLRPAECIDFLLATFVTGALQGNFYTSKFENQKKTEEALKSDAQKAKDNKAVFPFMNFNEDGGEGYITYDFYTKDPNKRSIEVKHIGIPSVKNIFYAIQSYSGSDNYNVRSWGRMYNNTTLRNRSVGSITSESPVWSICKNLAQEPLNEFWIDETGNVVLRPMLQAKDYTVKTWEYFDAKKMQNFALNVLDENNHPIIEDPRWYGIPQFPMWQEIKSEDILSMTIKKSDSNLKTVVIDNPIASVYGSASNVAAPGFAPITEENMDYYIKTFVDGKSLKGEQGSKFKDKLMELKEKSNLKMMGFDLSTDDDIRRFWNRFGIRPARLDDLYSFDPFDVAQNAYSCLQFYANLFFTASVTVKGETKYKTGQKVFIKDLAFENFSLADQEDETNKKTMMFYVSSVDNSFVWGDKWVTTLRLEKGEIEGSFDSSFNNFSKTIK